jgi:hypothetical protein
VLGLLLPPAAWLGAIALFATSRSGPAMAVILTSFVGMFVGLQIGPSAL